MIDKFANLTRGEIARFFISPTHKKMLEKFFGRGVEGAKERSANFYVSSGLTRESLGHMEK